MNVEYLVFCMCFPFRLRFKIMLVFSPQDECAIAYSLN